MKSEELLAMIRDADFRICPLCGLDFPCPEGWSKCPECGCPRFLVEAVEEKISRFFEGE